MDSPKSAREIAEEAAEWATRLDTGSVQAGDARLREWLAGDARRSGALLRAEAALSFVDRGRALAGVIERPEREIVAGRRRLILGGLALAASATGIAVWLPLGRHYRTGLGEVRAIDLADGSLVSLNTQSVVGVTLRPELREITLVQGEAWFNVAHDARRPFIVSAGRIRVRAVGTAFSVRRHDDGADVQVTEGVVETWTVGEENRQVRVAAGSKARVNEYETARVTPAPQEIERSLAWRDGHIVLEGETLDQAVAQFNRYNARKLVITDPVLADERLVGQFEAREPETFAAAVATTLGAKVNAESSVIRIGRQHAP